MKPLLPRSIRFNVKILEGKEKIFKKREIGQIYETHFKIKKNLNFNFKGVALPSTFNIIQFDLISSSKQFIIVRKIVL